MQVSARLPALIVAGFCLLLPATKLADVPCRLFPNAGARQLLKRYPLHKCGHDEEHCSAADCLAAQLGVQVAG